MRAVEVCVWDHYCVYFHLTITLADRRHSVLVLDTQIWEDHTVTACGSVTCVVPGRLARGERRLSGSLPSREGKQPRDKAVNEHLRWHGKGNNIHVPAANCIETHVVLGP